MSFRAKLSNVILRKTCFGTSRSAGLLSMTGLSRRMKNAQNDWKRFLILAILTLAILTLDLVVKHLAQTYLTQAIVVHPLLVLQLHYNTGIAFSIPLPYWFVIPMSVLILGWLVWLFAQQTKPSWLTTTAFGLLLGGALGNLVERIVAGSVTDFVSLLYIPFFNLADVAICTSVVLLILFQKRIFRIQ